MAGSTKNFADVIRPTKTQGNQFRQNRRVLGDLNQNIIRAPSAYPYADGLPGKRKIPSKKPLAPVGHRTSSGLHQKKPVTRGLKESYHLQGWLHAIFLVLVVWTQRIISLLSAQTTTKPSLTIPERKKPKLQTTPDEIYTEECGIIDVEDHFNAPMFVQHTEAMLEEIDKMDEDVYEEPVLAIDNEDTGDPLAVVEYIEEIYARYRKQEILSCVSPSYMSQQHEIKDRVRAILVDWLIEVHYKFELMDETLYLTVNLIDRFLERQTVTEKKLQLVGVTAMLLACKYEGVSVSLVDDSVVISDKPYTRTEILDMEKEMLKTLQFNLSVPTPYVFIKRFLKAARSYKKLELLAFYLIDMCLVEYEMLRFPPSLLAAAAVFTAECTLNGSRKWTKTCEFHSNYSVNHLMECSKMMVSLHQKSGTERLVSVFKKYDTSKYGYTARTQPANFMLDPMFWD